MWWSGDVVDGGKNSSAAGQWGVAGSEMHVDTSHGAQYTYMCYTDTSRRLM